LGYPELGSTVQQGQAAMCAKKQGSLEDLAIIGVDIGKDVFHLVGFDRSGQVVLRRKINVSRCRTLSPHFCGALSA
jgi:hypothetical protein